MIVNKQIVKQLPQQQDRPSMMMDHPAFVSPMVELLVIMRMEMQLVTRLVQQQQLMEIGSCPLTKLVKLVLLT